MGEIIAALQGDGYDATEADALLAHFEQLQTMHVAERDSLLRQLHMAHLRGLLLRTLLPRREQAGAAVSAG